MEDDFIYTVPFYCNIKNAIVLNCGSVHTGGGGGIGGSKMNTP